MSRIGIWFDGGGRFGFGNICRSCEMGRELAGRGHEVTMVALSSKAESICSCPVGALGRADVVLLDVPFPGDKEVRMAHQFGAKVVALDYEGGEKPEAVVALQGGRSMPTGTRRHVGIEFAIIRSELRAVRGAGGDSGEVLVILGGGDSDGLSNEIARRLPSVPLVIVQGPNGGTLRIERENVRILERPPKLPQLMSSCRWAVTSGGTTMLEMLHLGKAVHVVPRTEAENTFAKHFLTKSAILGIGIEDLIKPETSQKRLCEARGAKLIDGLGAERIADIVEDFL